MISFNDTSIVFASKSDKELRKLWWLFRLLSIPWIFKTGNLLLKVAIFLRFPVRWIVKPTIFKHFAGGETLEACIPVVERLAQNGVMSILDYSVEGELSENGHQKTFEEILHTVEFAAKHPHVAFSVFKPTALIPPEILEKISEGHQLNDNETNHFSRFNAMIDRICALSHEKNIPVLIDAEDYCYQHAIDKIALEMMRKYNREKVVVFNTFQMYRTDRPVFLQRVIEDAKTSGYLAGIKLVRGAYMEKERQRALLKGYPSPIFPDKVKTDEAFNQAIKQCIDNMGYIALFCGTHNEESCRWLMLEMNRLKIRNNDQRIWFSQLYGMGDHLSYPLAAAGYNVVKYIPYGPVKAVIPYLIRRAAENTSVNGQAGRELSMINAALKQRKIHSHVHRK